MSESLPSYFTVWRRYATKNKPIIHSAHAYVLMLVLWPILVPRGRTPFGQHQESRPLARSNNGSARFTDFPSLCACSVKSDKSDWFRSHSIMFAKLIRTGISRNLSRRHDSWCWPKGARPLGTRMVVEVLSIPLCISSCLCCSENQA